MWNVSYPRWGAEDLNGGVTRFVGFVAFLLGSCQAGVARVGMLRIMVPLLGFVSICVMASVGVAFRNNVLVAGDRFVVDDVRVSMLGSFLL